MNGVIEIAPWQLAIATGFIIVAAVLSLLLSLGFVRSLLIATLRTYLQLGALGFALRWVFGRDSALLVLGILTVMMVMAAKTVLKRLPGAPAGIFPKVLNAVFISGVTVTFTVTALIIGVEPWHKAAYVIPICGMVIGNSMTGLALSLERAFSDLRKRRDEIDTLLALGATPREAALPSIRTALTAGLLPTINAMSAVGIVFIPGMMTGQILAGSDPARAAAYQIVVMLMVSAATALGSVIAVMTTYGLAFDDDGRFVLPGNGAEKRTGRHHV
jgi:putative ABC transport system permease protein